MQAQSLPISSCILLRGQKMKALYLPLLLLLLFCVSPVQAKPEGNTASRSAAISQQQAVAIAQRQFPGRVLSVKRKGEAIHVKILNNAGDVRIIKVNASNANKR